MTSKERHQQRYLRRKAAREAARAARVAAADNYEKVFTYDHLYDAYTKCRRNVSWKASVQRYIANAPLNVQRTHEQLMAGRYHCPEFFEFDIFERGKRRHIKSTVIGERVVQRCLCDYALIPTVCNGFIYDNGASRKRKGYTFAVERMLCHLEKYVRQHGTDGYILIGDLKNFFDSVPHWAVEDLMQRSFTDERIKSLVRSMVRQFDPDAPIGEGRGLGLGSQVSQIIAPAIPGRLDHYVKEVLRQPFYGRYMDDFYLIHQDKEYLAAVQDQIRDKCAEVGLRLSDRKTHIVKLTHGFEFLKVHTYVTASGHIVKKLHPRSITRQRRKMKKLRLLLDAGEVQPADVINSWQSWDSHAARFDAWHARKNMKELFAQLFPELEDSRRERSKRWIPTSRS